MTLRDSLIFLSHAYRQMYWLLDMFFFVRLYLFTSIAASIKLASFPIIKCAARRVKEKKRCSPKPRFLHRNETSLVSLRLLDGGVRVQEAIYGHNYTLRAEISRPDGSYLISHSVVRFYVQTIRTSPLAAVSSWDFAVRSTVSLNIQFAGMYGIRVKNCFAFNKLNSSVQLIDDKG